MKLTIQSDKSLFPTTQAAIRAKEHCFLTSMSFLGKACVYLNVIVKIFYGIKHLQVGTILLLKI